MLTTLVFAAFIAQASQGQSNHGDQPVMVSLAGTTMTCTKEGDHLVCVVPLDKQAAQEPQQPVALVPKVTAYKPSRPEPALPTPEALIQLKAAEANIELAKAMLPNATTPEEAVLAQQLLYRAKEQYRTARALLHTVQADLRHAPDPFDSGKGESDAEPMALCQSEVDVAGECDSPQQGL
jgi:hypothetical protein